MCSRLRFSDAARVPVCVRLFVCNMCAVLPGLTTPVGAGEVAVLAATPPED